MKSYIGGIGIILPNREGSDNCEAIVRPEAIGEDNVCPIFSKLMDQYILCSDFIHKIV